MLMAKDIQTNEVVSIHDANRNNKYCCPICHEPVIIKHGQHKIPHFAHARHHLCHSYKYKKESPLHLSMKHNLYQLFRHLNHRVALEYYIKDIEQIPDVFVNHHTAIEIQCSNIPFSDILMRSNGYYECGFDVVWIIDYQSLKFNGHLIDLTQFQQSLICGETLSIYALDNTTLQLHQIYLFSYCGDHTFMYYDHIISANDLLNRQSLNCKSSNNKLNHIPYHIKSNVIQDYIKRCRRKRNVNDLTLTAMYYAQRFDNTIPSCVGITTCHSLYCKISPVTWQMLLQSEQGTKLLIEHSFFMRTFYDDYKLTLTADRIDLLTTEYYDRINNIHNI